MDTSFETIQVTEIKPHIKVLTLDRPLVRNAINSTMMNELYAFWQKTNDNPHDLRCIILTGKKDAFCAGADLKERLGLPLSIWQAQHSILRKALLSMMQCPVPIIAAVNGPAFGGGLELVLASDFAYAAATAIFAQSEVKIGLIPGAFGTQNLPFACGLKRAKELIFTGKGFTAQQAHDWGIINKVCQPTELMNEVMAVADLICKNAPVAVLQAKKALNTAQKAIYPGFDEELASYRLVLATKDREEGIRAFNEKREPVFVGE